MDQQGFITGKLNEALTLFSAGVAAMFLYRFYLKPVKPACRCFCPRRRSRRLRR